MLPLSLQHMMATKWDHVTLNSLSPPQASPVFFLNADGHVNSYKSDTSNKHHALDPG